MISSIELYKKIAALQKKVFGAMWPRTLDEAIAEYVQLIHVEAVELLQKTNFKKHRAIHPLDEDGIKEEIADLAIYVTALASTAFSSYEEFMLSIESKVNKNTKREDWEMNRLGEK